jgi:transposase
VLTVDDYGAIRRALRDGMSIRQVARQLGHSRKTIRRALVHAEPHPEPLTRNRWAPKLGAFQAPIDQILADDEDAPPKQRHTAAQIFRRLRDEHGYMGQYAQVQRYVRKHRPRHEETFVPLGHPAGQRLEADFGHIHVDFPDGRRLVPFLVTTWSYSNAPFAIALPFERTEAVLEGMIAAFEFFGAVPHEVWWDNPRTVATLIFLGRERQVHPRYAAFASHYIFEPRFCMPGRGNEKPDAEGAVKAVQKRFATPVPRVASLDELNASLRTWCQAERDRVVQSLSGPFLIKDRLAEDLAAASPLPRHRFDPCVIRPAVPVDKYQTVAFDGNRYSVPRRYAFEMVTVKGYVDRVVIAAHGQAVATHERSLQKPRMILEPIHYLAALEKKPAALDHAPVFRDWKLPACFADLRAELQRIHGELPGSRRFVSVLQLLREHPMSRVSAAIEACTRDKLSSVDAVIQRTRSLAAGEVMNRNAAAPECDEAATLRVEVPLPDLGRFDQLLSRPASGEAVSVFFA